MQAMEHAQPLWLYFLLVAGIVALPGMDMAYVAASSLSGGRRAGLAATAGITCAGFVHVGAGLLGLGLLLQAAPSLFNALLIAGSLYLAHLGWQIARSGAGRLDARPLAHRQFFARGALTALLNPKAYLFGLLVFPAFGAGASTLRGLQLAAITAATQILIYGLVAWLAGARALQGHALLNRGVGALLIATAAWTLARGWQQLS